MSNRTHTTSLEVEKGPSERIDFSDTHEKSIERDEIKRREGSVTATNPWNSSSTQERTLYQNTLRMTDLQSKGSQAGGYSKSSSLKSKSDLPLASDIMKEKEKTDNPGLSSEAFMTQHEKDKSHSGPLARDERG